jgi:F-type H+-transporting ATPase subunit b
MRLLTAKLGILFVVCSVADAHGEESSLLHIDLGLMIWTVVSFIALLYILGRYAYKPMMFLVERREKRIRESLQEAEEAKRKAEAAAAEREEILRQAQDEARRVVEGAKEAAEGQRRRILDETREDAARMMRQAEEEIKRERRQALSELTETVADLATDAAERIVRAELDKEKHLKLIDELITELEGEPSG